MPVRHHVGGSPAAAFGLVKNARRQFFYAEQNFDFHRSSPVAVGPTVIWFTERVDRVRTRRTTASTLDVHAFGAVGKRLPANVLRPPFTPTHRDRLGTIDGGWFKPGRNTNLPRRIQVVIRHTAAPFVRRIGDRVQRVMAAARTNLDRITIDTINKEITNHDCVPFFSA